MTELEKKVYKKYLKLSREALKNEIIGLPIDKLEEYLNQDINECDVYISCIV